MNADGSGVEVRLTDGNDQDPAWSPDGGSIAFTRSRFGNTGVYVMNTDGSAVMRAQHDETISYLSTSDPTWSPDGTKLAFVRFPGTAGTSIAVVDLNGDELEPANELTGLGPNLKPAWSPDGTSIVYASADDGDFELFSVPTNGQGPIDQLTTNGARDFSPDWQPVPSAATAPTCSIGSARATEGTGGASVMSFPVTCENPDAETYRLDYSLNNGTAVAPQDFASETEQPLDRAGHDSQRDHRPARARHPT